MHMFLDTTAIVLNHLRMIQKMLQLIDQVLFIAGVKVQARVLQHLVMLRHVIRQHAIPYPCPQQGRMGAAHFCGLHIQIGVRLQFTTLAEHVAK